MVDEPSKDLDEAALAELREDLGDAFPGFVERFLESAREGLQAMHSELCTGGLAAAGARAHALKGSAGYLGAQALAQALGGLQRAAQGGDAARAAHRLTEARERFERLAPRLLEQLREG